MGSWRNRNRTARTTALTPGFAARTFVLGPISVLYRLLIWLTRPLDDKLALKVVSLISSPVLLLLRGQRMINIHRLFLQTGWSERRCYELARKIRHHHVQLILESLRLASMSPAQVRAKGILEGEHHLSDALNRGQGALIVGNHVGNWLFSAAFLSLRGYRVSGVAYEIPIKSIEQHMLGLWRKYDLNVTHVGKGAPAAAVQTFKRNEVFLVLADVSLRPGHGAWFRLGQTAINVDTGPARLALLTNTTILTLSSRRKSDGRYVVSISPEIDRGEFAESPTALTQYWMDVLYREILETPDQWWLMNLVPLKLQRDVILASLAEPKTHWAGISERD